MSVDPVVLKKIGLKKIYIHESHMLPVYRDLYPFYDRALARICHHLQDIDQHLVMIDIGANVGDSVALITDTTNGSFLCIEGDEKYLPLLKKNVSRIKNSYFEIEPSYCSNGSTTNVTVVNKHGTARLVHSKHQNKNSPHLRTLDQIILDHPQFKNTNLVKIDTDGFEINILEGASRLLQQAKPVIYFEFTPELYQNLGQDPFKIITLLLDNGYDSALFYDNFGKPIDIVDLTDTDKIRSLISRIDNKNVYYYDILTFHHRQTQYRPLFTRELFGHTNTASDHIKVLDLKLQKHLKDSTQQIYPSANSLNNLIFHLSHGHQQIDQYTQLIRSLESRLDTELQKNQQLDQQIATLNRELATTNDINSGLQLSLASLQNQYDHLASQLETVVHDRHLLTEQLRSIYQSYGWRLLRHVYLWRDQILPPGFSFKKTRLFLSSIFHALRQRLVHLKNSSPSKSKKIIYIDHSFHNLQTKSTVFFIDILKKFFDVETVWHDDWSGYHLPDLSYIDESYAGVVFFQVMPDVETYKKIKNSNIVFVPMYDHSVKEAASWWQQYPSLKIINFSRAMHDQVTAWGCNSIYVQRFPQPNDFIPGSSKRTFFYCRGEAINFQVVKKLIGHIKGMKIHIHKTMDPGQTFVPPSTADVKKYSITFSEWFKEKADKWKAAAPMGLLIAPRLYEGIGQDFIEGMAFGKAVVAPNLSTMNEYIIHNQTGYLYDVQHPQPLDISNIKQVQRNAHHFITQGYAKWLKRQQEIIDFINLKNVQA